MLLKNAPASRQNPWRLSLVACFGLTTGVVLVLNFCSDLWKWSILGTVSIYMLLWLLSGLVTKFNGLSSHHYKKWTFPTRGHFEPLILAALFLLEVFYLIYLWSFLTQSIFIWEFQGGFFRPNLFYSKPPGGVSLLSVWYATVVMFAIAIVARFLLRQYSGVARFTRRSCLETSLIVVALGSVFYILPWSGISSTR